jgi:hypothetical protein
MLTCHNIALHDYIMQVDIFFFVPAELEAVSNDFYHDFWEVIRLHTPKVVPHYSYSHCGR